MGCLAYAPSRKGLTGAALQCKGNLGASPLTSTLQFAADDRATGHHSMYQPRIALSCI